MAAAAAAPEDIPTCTIFPSLKQHEIVNSFSKATVSLPADLT
uniref:Uncharacterized protein n=1 Tax=Arundo donax TaxID=35708 RepID=A0A0A9G4Q5_ARUDO